MKNFAYFLLGLVLVLSFTALLVQFTWNVCGGILFNVQPIDLLESLALAVALWSWSLVAVFFGSLLKGWDK